MLIHARLLILCIYLVNLRGSSLIIPMRYVTRRGRCNDAHIVRRSLELEREKGLTQSAWGFLRVIVAIIPATVMTDNDEFSGR